MTSLARLGIACGQPLAKKYRTLKELLDRWEKFLLPSSSDAVVGSDTWQSHICAAITAVAASPKAVTWKNVKQQLRQQGLSTNSTQGGISVSALTSAVGCHLAQEQEEWQSQQPLHQSTTQGYLKEGQAELQLFCQLPTGKEGVPSITFSGDLAVYRATAAVLY